MVMSIKEIQDGIDDLFREEENESREYIIQRYERKCEELCSFICDNFSASLETSKYDSTAYSKDILLENVKKQFKGITDTVDCYLRGDLINAMYTFNETFKFYADKNKSLIHDEKKLINIYVETIDYQDIMYRVRNNEAYDLYSPDQMFHIPFELRGRAGNQRYSLAGYPCLYLGRSIYGCWEETNRPNLDKLNIVVLKPKKKIKLVSLIIPEISEENKITANYLLSLALRLACSLRVNKKDDVFKPEYIIPQLVLNCVINQNKWGDNSFFGIQYTSTTYNRAPNDLFVDRKLMTNYIFPVISSGQKDGLCNRLRDLFVISKPTTLTNLRITRDAEPSISWSSIEYKKESTYERSELGVLEKALKKELENCDSDN